MTVWSNIVKGQSLGINSWFERNGNSVTLKQEIRYRSTTPVTDSSNVLNWSGHIAGSMTNPLKVNYWTGETVLTTLSTVITIPTGSNISKTLNATISNVDYVGGNLSVSETVSYTGFPNNITSASASRVSDTQANVTWTNNHGSTGYSGVRIDRWSAATGWQEIANVAGNATSYSDHSIKADTQYRYRVWGRTSTGLSASATLTGYIYTTPTAPTSLTASKSGTTINLAWTNKSSVATGIEVRHGVGSPVVWDSSPLAILGASATSYSHTNADPSKVHVYAVRATVASLSSSYAASNAVQLQAPPAAPKVSTPNVIDFAVTPLTVTWVHNPVDSSQQTNAQVRYRPVGGTWTTITNKLTSKSHTFVPGTFANGTNYEFQVATKGDHASYGPWSASALVLGSSAPTVAFTPHGTYGKSSLTVNLAYFQAESSPMASAVVTLKKAGRVIESKFANSTTIVFNTKLDNDSTYSIEARVQSGHGVWSNTLAQTIETDFPNPPKPTIAASFDAETGSVSLSVSTPEPRTNLTPNPSFEVDTSGWSSGMTISKLSNTANFRGRDGDALLQLTANGTNTYAFATTRLPVPAGASHLTLAATVWNERDQTPIRGSRVELKFFDQAGAQLSIQTGALVWSPFYESKRVRLATPVPDGAVEVAALLATVGNGMYVPAGHRTWWDAVTLEAGETDGSWFNSPETYADFVEVYRYDDGNWTLVGTTETNGSLVDTTPPLGTEVAYKAVAMSYTPSSRDSNIAYVETPSPWIFLNGGSGFATRARLKANASVDYTIGRSKVLHTFAGNQHATEFVGEARINEFKVQGAVAGYDLSKARWGDYKGFEAIADLPAPICYRDPMGRKVMGSLSDVSIRHETTSELTQVSFTVTKVQDD